MALDGFTVANIRYELDETLSGGYITKIAQPETDELLITAKNNGSTYRLLLSASPSLPLAYFTDENKPGPLTAPAFCMLLRKHIGSGNIVSITQPGLERVLVFTIEHRNELGDICRKKLILELMGKHSNIIFTDDEDNIIDAIKRVSANISSVREVLPGRKYFIPQTMDKLDPLTVTREEFDKKVFARPDQLSRAICSNLTGFSPLMGEELANLSDADGAYPASECSETRRDIIWNNFSRMIGLVKSNSFAPRIYYERGAVKEFAPFELSLYDGSEKTEYPTVSEMLRVYYAQKETASRIKQRSADLRKIVATALERKVKKQGLQEKQLKDTEKKDKYRVYGELLNAYGYECAEHADKLETTDYYTGKPITVPMDPTKSASENAKKYFDRYSKLKRTAEAVTVQLEETRSDVEHLRSIQTSLQTAADEADLSQIRDELADYGYVRKSYSKKAPKRQKKAAPLHFVSSDGFDIFVGKNNYQNDVLTFEMASGNDWWFHAKQMPGSHVVLRTLGKEVPDRAFIEAANAAAYFSSGRSAGKVEVDYTIKKNVKKPAGSKPGFVVYYTNYSMMAEAEIGTLRQI